MNSITECRKSNTSPRVSATSIAAFESLDPEVKSKREQKILEYIRNHGGATSWEVQKALGLLHQSASPCITRLRNAGHLVDSGERRPTNTGCMATVWRVAHDGG
jgi:predicted ArsR family transcriptional regulator